ncbi:transporter substrate-binding domain-containing protein [Enterobacteriaceae bacterium RIT702]|nr:transporter substrate-binding domain-containing protein [Enterobacteriaceae bacterium RIT702]
MANSLKKIGLALLLFTSCYVLNEAMVSAAEQVLNLKLLSRSPQLNHLPSQGFNAEQQQWLATKPQLTVGIARPSYPPFTIINNHAELEGITADYVGLLAAIINKPVKIRLFSSQKAAEEALNAGTVDLLGSVTQFDNDGNKVVRTEPYASEQAILAMRSNNSRTLSSDLAGEHIAMASGYLPLEWVQRQYPLASIQTYPSYQQAIGAVAFGDADVFLGDLYPISRNFINNIRVVNFAEFPAKDLAFGVRSTHPLLQQIVNIALQEINNEERLNILQRWHVGRSASVLNQQIFQLSDAEKQWIKQHNKVRVVAIDGFAPLTFTDDEGNYRGITVDMLAQIRLRTGLDFEMVSARDVSEMQTMLKNNQADMIGALTPSTTRKNDLMFSRAYFTSAFVMVVRQQPNAARNLNELNGKKLAVINGTGMATYIRSRYPLVKLVDAASASDALAMLNRGDVDAAANTLANSEYQIARYYRNRMRISATLNESPAFLSFAVPPQSPELLSIIDKVMLSIPPDEMDVIGNLWRPNNMVSSDNFWRENRIFIYSAAAFATALILVSLLWAIWLRRQIRIKIRVQRELNDQLEFMNDMINGTPNATYIRDASGTLTQCNESYLQFLNATREQVINQSLFKRDVFHDKQQNSQYIQDFYQVLSSGTPIFKDRTFVHASGAEKTIFHWLLPYRDASGNVKGVIGGWLDVSERRVLLEALNEAKEQAEDANRAKTQFLSTMSHEIRTPLNAVIGMLEMARKSADKNRVDHQALDVAFSSANELVELLGDILDIARIEAGKLTLQPERCNVQALCQSVVRVFSGMAAQKNLDLHLSVDPQTGPALWLDPLRFKQILSNLLGNAIKFTASGSVSVDVRLTHHERWQITATVRDTGKGISLADQQKLFTPFSQVGQNGEQVKRGTGLGLTICKTLCEKMDGDIQLHSELGKGSEIVVRVMADALPDDIAEATTIAELPAENSSVPLRILIVDDSSVNRLLLTRQLHFLGHQVIEAEEGAQALAAWHQQRFDVVITDCRMPVMDGYRLAQAIRREEQQRDRSRCMVLGFTANALPEERDRCREAGMDGCLFKPSTLQDLQNWLGKGVLQNADEGVLQLAAGDEQWSAQLRAELIESYQQDIVALTVALSSDDREQLGELAHKIKGSAGITGANALVAKCVALEENCEDESISRAILSASGRELLAEIRLEIAKNGGRH